MKKHTTNSEDSYLAQVKLGELALAYVEVFPWTIRGSLWGPKVKALVVELYNPRKERTKAVEWRLEWFFVSSLRRISDLDREVIKSERASDIEMRLSDRIANMLYDKAEDDPTFNFTGSSYTDDET